MHSTASRQLYPAGAGRGFQSAPAVDAANQAGSANPLYYLDNFQRVLDWIDARYRDLLVAQEIDFLDAFAKLPQASRALLVRMIMRKGSLFRASKLAYEEIGCPLAAAAPLLARAWLGADPALSIEQLFAVCSKAEIAAAFALTPSLHGQRKADQLLALRQDGAAARPFSHWLGAPGLHDPLLQIQVKPLCERLRLIFFGNLRQDWTELILSDMGLVRYEQVAISPASRGFRSRHDVELYLQLHAAKQAWRAGLPVPQVLAQMAAIERDDAQSAAIEGDRAQSTTIEGGRAPLPSAPIDNDWLDSRHQRLRFQLAQQLEKEQAFDEASLAYAGCRYPGARARAVRVLEKTRQFGAAHRLLKTALAAPESEAERQQLLRIAPRLTRQLGLPTARAPKAPPPLRLDLCLPRPTGACWVEGVVREHLNSAAAPVLYVENALINALFGLLCWEAIFHPLPGAFFHPYHRAPVDLYSADFVSRRASQFAACLDQLDSDAYLATMRANFVAKHGIASAFVGWDFLDAALLELALACIAADHLKRLFERLLVDLQANRSGFPDLIQFFPDAQRYRMIEVKGPGDRLQDNQLRWLDYCARHQLPVAVCYLTWQESTA